MEKQEKVPGLGEFLSRTWKDLQAQYGEARDKKDTDLMTRALGGEAVLVHVASALGYEMEIKGDGQGKEKTPASRKSGRAKKTKAAKSK